VANMITFSELVSAE